MFEFTTLTELMIEWTSRCNAACPECLRTTHNSFLKKDTLKLETFKKIFDNTLATQIEYIDFDGNVGDCLVSPDFLEALEFLNKLHRDLCKILRIKISTNGSFHDDAFWIKLAQLTSNDLIHGYVDFGIDGVTNDIHSTYRVNTNLDRVLHNAAVFIKAGGKANWVMLPFSHNEDQIEQCRQTALAMGFSTFKLKVSRASTKFFSGVELSKELEKEIRPLSTITDKGEYIRTAPIHCRFNRERKIFISPHGEVWPCCFLPGAYHYRPEDKLYERFGKNYEEGWNSLYSHSLKEILEHRFFTTDLEEMFFSQDRLDCCPKKCGVHSLEMNSYKKEKL